MDLNRKIVPAVYIRLLVDMLQEQGVDPDALLEGTGIELPLLADPTYLLSLEQEMEVYEQAERLSPSPDWALRVGQRTSPTTQGVLGYMVLTSIDIEHALKLIVKFLKLSGSASGAELRQHGDGDYEIRLIDVVQRPTIHRSTVEELFSTIITSLREFTRGAFSAQRICFDYPAPHHLAAYEEIFGCPLHFDHEYSALVVAQQDLSRGLPTWNPLMFKACERQCEEILQQLSESEGFADEVRKTLLVQPCNHRSAELVAEKLHMSTRNLRRKLEREGTSFQQVLDDVRCELAKQFLSKTQLRLEDIAPLLGFAEIPNLRRAFKKWTGQTPSEYRASLLGTGD